MFLRAQHMESTNIRTPCSKLTLKIVIIDPSFLLYPKLPFAQKIHKKFQFHAQKLK